MGVFLIEKGWIKKEGGSFVRGSLTLEIPIKHKFLTIARTKESIMKMNQKRFFTGLSIVTLLAPMLLTSVEVFAEDFATSHSSEVITAPLAEDLQVGPDLETITMPPVETTPIVEDVPVIDEPAMEESSVIDAPITEAITDEKQEGTELITDETIIENTPETLEENHTTDSSIETHAEEPAKKTKKEEATSSTSDGTEEDKPDKDWTGGIGIDDLEVDEQKDGTITLTAAEIIKNDEKIDYVKTTDDGLLSVKLDPSFYLSNNSGYDTEQDNLYTYVYGSVSLADPNSGILYSFSYNPGEISAHGLGDHNYQVFYFKDKKGKVTEYTLNLKITDEPIVSEEDFEMSEKTSGIVVTTGDLIEITPNYEKFNWHIKVKDNQWKILNHNAEDYKLSKLYEKRTYNIVLYSEELQEVKIYKFKVDRMISESDTIEHEIDLKLSRNNQFRFGNEFYQEYDDKLAGLSVLANYDSHGYYFSVKIENPEDSIYFNENLYYYTDKIDGHYISYLEVTWLKNIYDEDGNYIDYVQKNAKIKLNIHLDNTTEIDESKEKSFDFAVDHNDLIMNSKEDKPYEVSFDYGGPSNVSETFRIAYLNTNAFDQGKDTIYKGEYVKLYEGSDYVSTLSEPSPGFIQAYSDHGNSINFTILNAPEIETETVEINVGRKNNEENSVTVSPKSDNNLTISAYRDYNQLYSLSYDFDYDGIHHYEALGEWDYNVPEDSGTIEKTIYKRKGYGGKIVAIYHIQFNLEKIEYELQDPIHLAIPKKLGFNRVYAETPDAQIVIIGSSWGGYEDDNFNFNAHVQATKDGVNNNISFYYNDYWASTDDQNPEYNSEFLYTESQDGVYKKYPVIISPDFDGKAPSTHEYYTFDLEATAQELIEVRKDEENFPRNYGKAWDYAYSKYESAYFNIFLDKENRFNAHGKETAADERFVLFPYEGGAAVALNKTSESQYTFKYEDGRFLYNLTITDRKVTDILPTKLTLSESKVTIAAGETATINATITPKDATNQSLKWTSEDEKIATVTNGVITGHKEGKTTITTETVNGLKETVKVIVEKVPEKPIIKEELKDESGSGVSVSAPAGVLPKGAELKVEPIQSNNDVHQKLDELTEGKFVLFDIKLENSGQNVQPNGMVAVRVPIPTGFDPAKIKMYRFDEVTGKRTALNGWVDGAYYVFETDRFSYYTLVEEEPVEEKEDTETLPEIDKKPLEGKIQSAEALNQTDYTSESWMLFTEKLRAAQGTAANKLANEKDVKTALDELTAAMNALVKTPAENNNTEDKNEGITDKETDNKNEANNQKPVTPESPKVDSPKTENTKVETENPKASEKDLPQLGDAVSIALPAVGLLLIALTGLIFFRRRKA